MLLQSCAVLQSDSIAATAADVAAAGPSVVASVAVSPTPPPAARSPLVQSEVTLKLNKTTQPITTSAAAPLSTTPNASPEESNARAAQERISSHSQWKAAELPLQKQAVETPIALGLDAFLNKANKLNKEVSNLFKC